MIISKPQIVRVYFLVFFPIIAALAAAHANAKVIGLVKGSTNASVGGETLLPDTTIFSGDRLEVNNGMAVVAFGGANRMIFQHDTVASFLQDSQRVTVLLSRGAVSLFAGESSVPARVKVGDISVAPVSGYTTLGEVAMGDGTVTVTAKDGWLQIERNGKAIIVAKGKTLKLVLRAGAQPAARASNTPTRVPPPASVQPAPTYVQEANAPGGRLSASESGVESTLAADTRGPLDAAVGTPAAPAMTPEEADTIELALYHMRHCVFPPSPYEPFFRPVGCVFPPRPHHPRGAPPF